MSLHLKEKLPKIHGRTENLRIHTHGALKKTIIATLVVSTITMNSAFVHAEEEPKLKTIYHVYVNDEFLGTVANKENVEKLVNEKFNQVKNTYQDKDLIYKTDEIVFIPEQIFRTTNLNDREVIEEIDEEFEIYVESVALKVNGESVAYLENVDKAEELLQQLKLKYISEEELNQLENVDMKNEPLDIGETRLLNVQFSENITLSIEEVKPEEVLTVADALTLLEKGTLEEKKYVVQEGDVLGTIANSHGLTLQELLDLNPQVTEDTILQIGDELNVTVLEPYVEVIFEKEAKVAEEIPYETEVIEDDSMFKGDSKVEQEGVAGEKVVTYNILEQGGQEIKREVKEEQVIKEPIKKVVRKGTKVIPSRGTGDLAWPTVGGYISSYQGYRWGSFHKGIDIARPADRTIKAADNGTVVFAGWDGGYGNKIVIDHNNGMQTVYAHLSSISVSVGQTVAKGSKIGVMGSTGNSTGIHLHFEVYKNGQLQNPMDHF